MKITKLAHSCLLVEMPGPVNRTVLFDPGDMSGELIRAAQLQHLDDIVITHEHFDHFSLPVIKELVGQFPKVRILATDSVVQQLSDAGIMASTTPSDAMELFESPHEKVEPLFPTPSEIGVHYLDKLTHPGDSLHFAVSKPILALPVDGPWGTTVDALTLAIQLKPKYVIPIHDWMWRSEWREKMYGGIEGILEEQGITLVKPIDGKAFVLDV